MMLKNLKKLEVIYGVQINEQSFRSKIRRSIIPHIY